MNGGQLVIDFMVSLYVNKSQLVIDFKGKFVCE